MSPKKPICSVPQKLEKYIPPLKKTHRKFIIRAVEGVIKSGTVQMSEIGRECRSELESPSSLKYIKRNLENDKWSDLEVYQHYWKEMGSKFVQPMSILSIDLGDISKTYAKAMEGLAEVWDGSKKQTANGYSTVEIIGVTEKGKQKPLLLQPFSTQEQDFQSQNRVVEKWIVLLFAVLGCKGIITSDRGFLWPEYIRLLDQYAKQLVLRLKVDIPLHRYGVSKSVADWVQDIPLTYQRHFTNKQGQGRWIHMGFLPVHYKEISRPMFLVVVKCSWYKYPMYLLTTINPKYQGNMKRIRQIYCLRWGVEDFGKFVKVGFQLEDVRVRNLFALKRLCLFCVLAFWILESIRQQGGALLKRILALAKPLTKKVKFLYYRILKGFQIFLGAFP